MLAVSPSWETKKRNLLRPHRFSSFPASFSLVQQIDDDLDKGGE
jgi:hypothetical protein